MKLRSFSGNKPVALLALLCIAALMISACGAGQAADTSPIKIGAISTLSGPVTFPYPAQGAKAVFDRVNAEGGINGRQIEFLIEDDKLDPALSTQAARRLVDEQGVLALVGGASILDCAVNGAFYQQQGVLAIPGAGINPLCFNQANIAPPNAGAMNSLTLSLTFASQELGHTRVCAVLASDPSVNDFYPAAVARWEEASGMKLHLDDRTFKSTDDPTPFVVKAAQAECQAVLFNGIDQMAIAWTRSAEAQGLSGIDFLFSSSAYTEEVAATIGTSANRIFALSEYEPFTGDSPALEDWRTLMSEANVPLGAWSLGGYLAATILVDTLKGIEGPITRESVAEALRGLEQYETPLIGTPYAFGAAEAHNPNQAGKFVELSGGSWSIVTPEFVRLP
jgi:branched-chain amino acid transport system substrate-binding protein